MFFNCSSWNWNILKKKSKLNLTQIDYCFCGKDDKQAAMRTNRAKTKTIDKYTKIYKEKKKTKEPKRLNI